MTGPDARGENRGREVADSVAGVWHRTFPFQNSKLLTKANGSAILIFLPVFGRFQIPIGPAGLRTGDFPPEFPAASHERWCLFILPVVSVGLDVV